MAAEDLDVDAALELNRLHMEIGGGLLIDGLPGARHRPRGAVFLVAGAQRIRRSAQIDRAHLVHPGVQNAGKENLAPASEVVPDVGRRPEREIRLESEYVPGIADLQPQSEGNRGVTVAETVAALIAPHVRPNPRGIEQSPIGHESNAQGNLATKREQDTARRTPKPPKPAESVGKTATAQGLEAGAQGDAAGQVASQAVQVDHSGARRPVRPNHFSQAGTVGPAGSDLLRKPRLRDQPVAAIQQSQLRAFQRITVMQVV